MENAKELRSKKANVKSKLMGAVSMLVVSAIMLSSTTYAWFTLSTAPEVSGMSTTVGANGSLEVALLDNATGGTNIGNISSGVGTSSSTAGKSVTESNITWGNIVSLSDESYGLQNVTLYPSVLNVTTANSTLLSRTAMLKYARYGTDGRVADLAADTAAGKKSTGTNVFLADTSDYGVRAIGSTTAASEEAIALADAQGKYATNVANAKSTAETALDGQRLILSEIAMAHANEGSSAYSYTSDQVDAINTALDGLIDAANKLQDALKWAKVADQNAGGAKKTSIDGITIDSSDATYGTAYSALENLKTEMGQKKIATGSTSYTWAQIHPAYQALMDTNTMTFKAKTGNGTEYTMDQMKNIDEEEGIQMAANGALISIKGGYYVDMANYVGSFSSGIFTMTITYGGRNVPVKNTNYTVTPSEAGKLTDITKHVTGLTYTNEDGGTQSDKETIATVYGYVVDLAFQTSAAGELRLSDAVKRVSSDEANATMGTGSYFTFADTYGEGTSAKPITTDDMKKAAKALRVVFVDEKQKILAVAGLKETNITDGTKKYALHVYNTTFTTAGGLTLGEKVENDKVTDLQANKPTAISAIVYMDGEYVDSTMNGVTGTLDLQFCSSAQLEPMNYTGYVNTQQNPGGGN